MKADLSHATWRKSTFSNGSGGNCVQVGQLPQGRLAVRDTQNRTGAVLQFSAEAWHLFITSIR